MLARKLIVVIVMCAVASAAQAQTLGDAIANATHETAAAQAPAEPRMPRKYFWLGLGLIGAGVAVAAGGAANVQNSPPCWYKFDRDVAFAAGGAMAGLGALALLWGATHKTPRTSIAVTPGGVSIQRHLRLGRARTSSPRR